MKDGTLDDFQAGEDCWPFQQIEREFAAIRQLGNREFFARIREFEERYPRVMGLRLWSELVDREIRERTVLALERLP